MVCDLFVLSPGKMLYGFLVVDSIFSWQEKARGPRINSKKKIFFSFGANIIIIIIILFPFSRA